MRAAKIAKEILHIEQSYLLRNRDGLTVRIRKQRNRKGRVKHVFTTKQRVDDKVIEIEKKISEADYSALHKTSTGRLTKIRYVVDGWEIDFFKNGLETYFVMAEIELADGALQPDRLHPFVNEYLLYAVPKEDGRFSSKKLSDVGYAKKLLEEVDRSQDNTGHNMGAFLLR